MPLRAFGLTLNAAMPLPGAWDVRSDGLPLDLELVESAPAVMAAAFSGDAHDGWRGTPDGRAMLVSLGRAGDVLVRLDGEPAFHLADGRLGCHLPDVTAQRVLLDSVLFTAALVHGYEAIHCGAVVGDGGVVAIAAETGGGKSTLVTELVAAGQGFVTDDILAVDGTGAAPAAFAGPPLLTRPGPPAREVGEPIAALDGETWCAVPVALDSAPLAALVLLDRRPGNALALEPVDASPLPILPQFMPFPQSAERGRARFEIAADIAEHVPVFRLTAAPDEAPSALVERLGPLL